METNKKNTPKSSPLIFYIILIILPILLLVGLEVTLRIFNYGRNLDAFITLSEEYDNYLFTNPDLPFRYAANMETPPAVSLDGFLKEKPDSTFRIFVMGGRSAAGFPYAYNATFPRYVKRKLEIVYPKLNFEVINLGITAHNSYTVADLANDVIKQNPDLVLVYAGHNEYYGILGVGSTIKFGRSQWLPKLIISLNKYKTFQLLNNLIKGITSLFANNEEITNNSETLMSRMIGNSNIPFNSETYFNGVEQFQTNMSEFLSDMKNSHVPVIIGGLTSNLLQPPFTSLVGSKDTKEDSLFTIGKQQLENNQVDEAGESFFWAKEYDGVRFRAPEAMNKTLRELSDDFEYLYLNIDSVFKSKSINGIVGYNLMIDHLHPNITGYNIIGEEFYKNIISSGILNKFAKMNYSDSLLSRLVTEKFAFTRLDSIVAKLRIDALLNQYPFVSKTVKINKLNFVPQNYIDTVAIDVVTKKISWRSAHQLVAEHHYKNRRFKEFTKEMDAIIENQPYAEIAYAFTLSRLINANLFNEAEKYLIPLHKLNPNDYTYKWIGSFALNKGEYKKAIKNLIESSKINPNDAQVYYNLSGAYFNSKNIPDAIKAIEKCLSINPNNQRAIQFYNSLKSLNKKSNIQRN